MYAKVISKVAKFGALIALAAGCSATRYVTDFPTNQRIERSESVESQQIASSDRVESGRDEMPSIPSNDVIEWQKDCWDNVPAEQPLICTYRNERFKMSAFITRNRTGHDTLEETAWALRLDRQSHGFTVAYVNHDARGYWFDTEVESDIKGVIIHNRIFVIPAQQTKEPIVVVTGWRNDGVSEAVRNEQVSDLIANLNVYPATN